MLKAAKVLAKVSATAHNGRGQESPKERLMTKMLETVEKFEDRAFDQVKHAEEPMLRFARETSDALAWTIPSTGASAKRRCT